MGKTKWHKHTIRRASSGNRQPAGSAWQALTERNVGKMAQSGRTLPRMYFW